MDDIDPRLTAIFARYPAILAVYLFGSRATGKTHAHSDLDLAVVPRPGYPPDLRLKLMNDLVREGFDYIDLLILDTDDLVLRYEVIKHNRVIYQAADFDRGTLYSNVVRQYLDFLPYLEVQRRAYKRRILGGQQRSRTKTT
ncbi:MAG: nucleotidyltransferase domain-containing protein [Caldilineae bacterium]|nr:MAG: nucleotidyltransferase domain-containing protein [Caldilineae bacterium]